MMQSVKAYLSFWTVSNVTQLSAYPHIVYIQVAVILMSFVTLCNQLFSPDTRVPCCACQNGKDCTIPFPCHFP